MAADSAPLGQARRAARCRASGATQPMGRYPSGRRFWPLASLACTCGGMAPRPAIRLARDQNRHGQNGASLSPFALNWFCQEEAPCLKTMMSSSSVVDRLASRLLDRLAQNGASVLVLEDGAAISDPPGSHFRNASRFIENPRQLSAGGHSPSRLSGQLCFARSPARCGRDPHHGRAGRHLDQPVPALR